MQQIEKENKEMLARAFPDGFPNKKKKNTKKIECPFCSKTFLYEEARDRHIKEMHSHEKTKSSKTVKKSNKYKCPFCERKFKTEEGKSQHITAVHPNKL
ncbi:hypothetical protein [Methanolobus bombayensis]|uniref:hypothetical protein n=1 Tax=Methanolobus bombayensis TaxID=38023 RepID=UPI001FD7D635|nr:hypothetical protein [Methanolobus bombayensis]MBP1909184.1 putative C2H2 Zn-finger protein [Methanolobus bombayensis]